MEAYDIFPMPQEASMDHLQPQRAKYVDGFSDMPGAPKWGPAEGHVSDLPVNEEFLWQSRTLFGHLAQDWTTYPPEAQSRLSRAAQGGESSVELCFAGSRFLVDLKGLKQYNKLDRTRVRDVRYALSHKKKWILISKSAEMQWIVMDDAACRDIEQGCGKRHLGHDAVLFEARLHRGTVYIDKARQRAYDSLRVDAFRSLLALPEAVWALLQPGSQDLELPQSSDWHDLLFRQFETTKFGGRQRARHEDLFVSRVTCHVRKRLYLQFMEKLCSWAGQARLLLCFHGTKEANRAQIVEDNFSMGRVSRSTGNFGWFGKGIYFGRRAYTALGYNEGSELLCCLVAVKDVFHTPPPDSSANPFHGKPCQEGYDAHLSPSAKELVVFNPRQILPCFTLHLSHPVECSGQQVFIPATTYEKGSPSDYMH